MQGSSLISAARSLFPGKQCTGRINIKTQQIPLPFRIRQKYRDKPEGFNTNAAQHYSRQAACNKLLHRHAA